MSGRLRHDLAYLAEEVRIVDLLHRAKTTSRRIGARRAALASTLAMVLVAGIATGVVYGLSRNSEAPPADPSPTPVVTTTHPALPDVRNTTLTVPDPQFADECGDGGRLTFVGGVATIAGAGEPATWRIGETTPVEGDLDGVPGGELVTTIRCVHSQRSFEQLVALKAGAGGELSVLGYVIPPGTELTFDPAEVRIEASVVQVTVTGTRGHIGLQCDRHVRGYAYQSGSFKQINGPTEFPEAPLDIHEADLRNAGLELTLPGRTPGVFEPLCVNMTDGTGTGMLRVEPSAGPVIYTFTIDPVGYATGSLRDFGIALVTHRSGGGPTVQSVQAIHRATDGFQGQILASTGVGGVTSVDGVRVDADRVIVTVTADGTRQEWTYIETQGSDVWARA